MKQSHHIQEVNIQQLKATCYKSGKEGHYNNICTSKGSSVKVHEVQAQPTAAQYQNCIPEEHAAVYFNVDIHSPQDCNCQETEQPKTCATNQAIMAEQRIFITDLPYRMWSWHCSKLWYPTTLKSEGPFWTRHPVRNTNGEADWLQWQCNQEP